MANYSYFLYGDDNKMKYKYFYKNQKKMGKLKTQPRVLHKG